MARLPRFKVFDDGSPHRGARDDDGADAADDVPEGVLGDWAPEVDGVWLYALADAARKHDVLLHHAVRMATHHHLTVTLTKPNLGEFLHHFHRSVSCGLNVLLAAYGYDMPKNVFDARQAHAMRLLNWEAEQQYLVYERLNPVQAGLVDTATDMPGLGTSFERWGNGALIARRPDVYFGQDRPAQLRLVLTPPPALLRAGGGDVKRLAKELLQQAAEGDAKARREHPHPALGPEANRAMHPWAEPKTLTEPGGGSVPRFKVGGTGPEAQELRIRAAKEWKRWKGGYWGTLDELPESREVPFPHGTYEMRRFHRANVADPHPGAVLSAPGNVDDVAPVSRDALREGAQVGIEESLESLRTAQEHEAVNAERGEAEERHRFTKRPPRKNAPRLIVKRDRRPGRPSPWAETTARARGPSRPTLLSPAGQGGPLRTRRWTEPVGLCAGQATLGVREGSSRRLGGAEHVAPATHRAIRILAHGAARPATKGAGGQAGHTEDRSASVAWRPRHRPPNPEPFPAATQDPPRCYHGLRGSLAEAERASRAGLCVGPPLAGQLSFR